MGAVASLVASGIRGRSRWGLVATVAVLALASLGVALGLAVNQGGAPLLDRAADDAKVAHLVLYGSPDTLRDAAAAPEVSAAAGPFATIEADLRLAGADPVALQITAIDTPSAAVNGPPQKAGRWTQAADEMVLDRSFAAELGLVPGDEVLVAAAAPEGSQVRFRIVGTAVNFTDCFYPNCDPGRAWVTTGGIARLDPNGTAAYGQSWLRFATADQADPFVQQLQERGVPGLRGTDSWVDTREDFLGVDRVLGASIGIFGIFVLAASAVIVAGTMTVRTLARRRELGLLQAVGYTPRQVSAALLGWFLGGLLAPSLRVGISAALGPSGFSWPLLGLAVSLAGVWLILTAATALPAARAAHRPVTEIIRDAPPAAGGVRGRLPRTLPGLGMRDATARPARSLLAALALAVAVTAAVVTVGFIRTIDRVVADPARVGDPWDVTVSGDAAAAAEIEAGLDAQTGVAGWYSELDRRSTFRQGAFLSKAIGGAPEDAGFVLGGGRPARAPDEAIAGFGFLQRFDVEVGDRLTFLAGTTELTVRLVGWYYVTEDSGEVVLYRLDALRAVEPDATPQRYRIRAAAGTAPSALAATLATQLGDAAEVETIDAGSDLLSAFKQALWLIAAVLGVMALSNLGTTLLTASREAARRIGVEQTLGFTPNQLTTHGAVTGAAIGAVAAIVGLPLGLAAYAAGDSLVASTGIGPGWLLDQPLPGLIGICSGAVLAGAALGALAVTRLAHRPAADLVRWE
jgi:putative ABC transport system permease protein